MSLSFLKTINFEQSNATNLIFLAPNTSNPPSADQKSRKPANTYNIAGGNRPGVRQEGRQDTKEQRLQKQK